MIHDGYKMEGSSNMAEAQEELEKEGLVCSSLSTACLCVCGWLFSHA
jgi:hypothetical protein